MLPQCLGQRNAQPFATERGSHMGHGMGPRTGALDAQTFDLHGVFRLQGRLSATCAPRWVGSVGQQRGRHMEVQNSVNF